MQRQGVHLRLRHSLTGGVLSLVELGFDPKPCVGTCIAYQVDNGLEGPQRLAPPVLCDVAEQPVLNLVLLAGARGEAAEVDAQTRLVGELLQPVLPGARAIPVAPARIGGYVPMHTFAVRPARRLTRPCKQALSEMVSFRFWLYERRDSWMSPASASLSNQSNLKGGGAMWRRTWAGSWFIIPRSDSVWLMQEGSYSGLFKSRRWAFVSRHLGSWRGVSTPGSRAGRPRSRHSPPAAPRQYRLLKNPDGSCFIESARRGNPPPPFNGPLEVDETHVGGQRRNMPLAKRRELWKRGITGPVNQAHVIGARDRATNTVHATMIERCNGPTLQGYVHDRTLPTATAYTDEAKAYKGMRRTHESVNHSMCEFVCGDVTTNGIESFWSGIKRAHKGVYHKFSHKHLDRYLRQFTSKHNCREKGTRNKMGAIMTGSVGRRPTYRALIEDNGQRSGARPHKAARLIVRPASRYPLPALSNERPVAGSPAE